MSIAEKLTRIAENEQKVYDAGYNKGYDEGEALGYENGECDGYNKGYVEGYDKGKSEGGDTTAAYEQGVADGKQAEYDAFWDAFQNYGNRTEYQYTFSGKGWNSETLKPKYDICPTNASYIFANWDYTLHHLTDLKGRLEECGVVLDTSQCTNFSYFFMYGSTQIVPIIDTRSASTINNFSVNSQIRSIEKIILKDDGSQIVNSMFTAAHNALVEVRFEGVIGNNLNMSTCSKLSVESMKSIISCLKNYKGTDNEFAYQCKFTSGCWAALEADSTAPDGNTWQEYVNTLGWNT